MRKIFKTIIVASLATLAMPLSASTMQTYTASSDSIDTTVEPADTLREKLAQMETRMASMEQEQEMQKTWKRRKYWKIGITSPNLERTDGEEMKWKTNGSFFIQKGRTSYLHSKPIAGMIKFGIDYGFLDFTYSKLELKEVAYSNESGTRASDGFDDIVEREPERAHELPRIRPRLPLAQVARKEDLGVLVGEARRPQNRDQRLHAPRAKPRLFHELPRGADGALLAALELARGDLERHATERHAVLAHEADAAVPIERDDACPAVVPDDLAVATGTVGKAHVEGVGAEDLPLPSARIALHSLRERGVGLERGADRGDAGCCFHTEFLPQCTDGQQNRGRDPFLPDSS